MLCFNCARQNETIVNSPTDLSKPAIFAEGVISTGDYETHPAFSPTGDTLVFLKGAPDMSTWTLCISYLKNGTWSSPVIAAFSGQYIDGEDRKSVV